MMIRIVVYTEHYAYVHIQKQSLGTEVSKACH